MSEKVKFSDTTSKKKSTPIKKTTEERKLKNKTSQNASSATPQRRNSAPARSARGKFDGPRMRLKGLPPPSPKEKPKVSKEHGPRRKDMRAFVIPRKAKEKELLEEVSLDSNSFQKYLLPAVVQQYRDPTSRASFEYEKAFLVHNDKLNTEFQERRKEMKEDGRSDREVAEQYAFLLVDNMNIAKLICQDGLHVRWTGQSREHRLGHGDMGVYLNRFSDILSATSLGTGKEHILLVFKVLKGKVKAVPLTHHKQAMEPTPKFDSHVAKNIVVDLTSSRVQTFVSNQIYCYQFGDLEMAKRPQQVCPFALVYFKYTERKKESTSLGGAFDVASKKDVTRKEEDITKGTKKPALYTTVYSPPITLWKGKLINGGKEHCSACLVSSRLPFLPTDLPRRLNLNTALPISKVKQIMPSNISKHPKLCHFSRYREVSAKGRYFSYAQMRRIGDKTAFLELFKCLKENDMALQKKIDNKLLFVLPPCTLTEELGVTKSVKTCVLHVLFVSNRSSFRILTDIGLKKAASRVEDEKPQLPVVSQSKTANCKADIGKVFQHMTSFYSGEKVKKKTPLRSAIRNSVSESKDPPPGEVSKDGNNRNINTDTVLKDATNSIVKDMKPSQNHLPQVVEAPQIVPTVEQVPFHSGRLEHVEGSFSPIEEDSPPPPQTQQDPRTLTKDTSDESNRARVKQGDKQGGSSELQDEQKFTYPPKPTRMFSQNSALPDINHKINQLTELVKVKEKIVSMSASSSDVSGTTEAVKGYQTRISELKGNLEMLLQERAGLKQAEQLKVSFQRQRVAEKLKALSPAVQMPTFSAEQDSIGMVTPNPSLSQHQPTTPDHSTYDYVSANESEPYFNSPDGEFPAQPPLVMDLDRKPIQESAQIFDYLKNILSSPHLQQQDIPPEDPGGESPVGPDPLSPAGLTLDSLRSILGRVQGQSPSGSGFPFPHSLMQQYPEVSEGLDPGPSTSYDTSMTSDVENNNKRQVEDGGGYLSSSKRLRTGDAGDPMTKLASILSTVSRNTTSSSVPATPQSPPPWETLSLVHKEIPPETPESPPPWDKCNELSAMNPQVGSEAQWSRNVIVKGDLNDQLTVTIKGPPVSNQSQGGPPDLYALVKSVLHGITRKMVASEVQNEYEISPPTQQEVHLQEIVLNTLHTQNPGNSQIQYGALRKVQEVARPLTHEKQRSISQRSSPRQGDSPRGSVSTSSNHSPSPPPKSDSGRSKSSIIEDGTSFQGDLTSEDGVSVGQPSYYHHKAKDQRHSPSSRSKVPKHRSDITNEGNGFVVRTLERQHLVVRRQTSHKLSFRATIPFSTPKNRKHSVCNKYSKTSNKLNCHKKKRKSKKKAYLREKSPQMYLCMKDHTLRNTGAHLKENVQQTLTLERKREKIEQPLTCKGGDEHLKEKLLQPLTPEGAGVHMKEKLLQPLTLGGGDEHVKEKLLQPPFLGGGDEHVKEKLLQPPFLGGGGEHVKKKLLQPPFLGGGDEHVKEKLLQRPSLGEGDEHVKEKLLQPPFLGGGDEHVKEKLLQPPSLGGGDEHVEEKLLQPPFLGGGDEHLKEKLLQPPFLGEGDEHVKEKLLQPPSLGGGDEHVKEKLLQPPFLGGCDKHLEEKLLQPPISGRGDKHLKEKLLQPPFLGGVDEHVKEKLQHSPSLGGGDEHVKEKLLQPPFLGGGDEHVKEKLQHSPSLGGGDEHVKEKLLQRPSLGEGDEHVKEKLLQPPFLGGGDEHVKEKLLQPPFLGGGDEHVKEKLLQPPSLGGGDENLEEKLLQPPFLGGGDEHVKEKLLQPPFLGGGDENLEEKLLQPLGGGDEDLKEKLLQPPFLGGGDEDSKEKLLQPPFLGGGDEHVKEKLLQPLLLGGGDEHVKEKLLQPPFLGGGDEHVEEKLLQPPFLGGGDEHLREKLLQPPFLGGHDEDLKDKLLQPPTLVGAGKQVKEKLLQHLLRDEGACVHSKEMLQQLHTFETPGKEDNLGYEIISGSDDCSGLLDMSFSDDNSPSPEIEVNFVYKEVDCVKKLEDGNARLRGNSKVEIRSVSHLMDGIYDKHGEMQPDRITHEDEKCLAKAPGCKIYNTGSEMYEEQTLANLASDVPGLPGTDCDSSSSLYTKMHTLSDLDRSDVQQTSKIDNGIVLFASSDQREVTKNIKTCEDQGPTHVQSLGSIEVNDQFVSNSRVLHQDESRKLTASENNSHHKLTPQGYDDEDGSRDTSHCSDDTSSLHNSFLLPSDPLATYLDFFDTAALDTATTNRISMDDTTDLDSCENSPIQSSFPSCDSHIVTPIRQTKGDGKLLSILFGTALKSPAAIAFKCSASQSSSVSSNVEHSEFDGNLKKQTIEEKFFQNQRFLKTTFNRPNGLLHQEMMTLISDNDLEGDEDPVLPCSSGNSGILDDPFEKSTPLLHGKLHPQPYHPDITANWQSRGMQVGMNFFKEAENSQQKYFLHTAATNKDMIGKKSVPVIDSTSYSPSKHPNSRNQYHQEVNQVFHNDTLPTKDLPDYECAGTEPGGHSGDDETISTPEIMRMLDEQLEGYQQLDRGTGQDICEGRDTKKNLNGCSKEDPLHFVENKCFSSEPFSNEVGKKTSWKEKQGLNASVGQLQPAVFQSGAMASLLSRCNSEGTVMDSTHTEPKDVDSDIGKGTESILKKLPDQQRKRQNAKMISPERLSSPSNLENKKELKSLVDELRTETLKKLKKHAGKVAKDLRKIKGFQVSKKEDGFKGTKWHLKWRVKDTKERRKKMKPKKLRQASKRQNPEEVQRAVLCLNDLACKVSRCSIDGGTTVVSSSLVEAGRRKFQSKILSTCHSPLKIPGTSPRTLPFKKDFTTSLLHRNVFGSFSAEGIGLSSPSRLTLIKTVQNTYKILSKRIKIASALKSATFVHRSLFSRQKKRSPVQTKEHCQENNKLDDKYCLKNGTDMHQCEDRSRCDKKTFVQLASSSQSQQVHQVQISNGYRNPPQPYNQLLLPLKLGRTTEHSLSHQPKESSTFSSVNQDTASLTSNPLTRFTSSSPRHLPYSSPYFTPAVRAPYILQPNLYLSLVQQQPLLHFMRGAFTSLNFTTLRQSDVNGIQRKMNGGVTESPVGIPREPRASDIQKSKEGHLWESDIVKTPKSSAVIGHGLPGNQRQISKSVCKSVKPVEEPELSLIDKVPSPPTSSDDGFFNVLKPVEHLTEKERKEVHSKGPPNLEFVTSEISQCSSFQGSSEADNQNVVDMVTLRGNDKHVTSVAGDVNKSGEKSEQECSLKMLSSHDLCGKGKQLPIISSDDASTTDEILTEEVIAKVSMSATKEGINRIMTSITTRDDKVPSVKVREGQTEDMLNKGIDSITTQKQEKVNSSPKKCSHANYADRRDNVNCEGQYKPCLICKDVCEDKTCVNVSSEEQVNIGSIPTHSASEVSNQLGENLSQNIGINDGEVSSCNGFQVDSAPESLLVLKTKKDTTGLENSGLSYNSHMTRWDSLSSKHYAKCEANVMTNESTPCPIQQPVEEFVHKESSSYTDEFSMKKCDPVHGCATASKSLVVNESVSQVDTSSGKMNNQTQGVVIEEKTGIKGYVDKIVSSGNILQNCKADVCTLGKDAHFDKVGLKTEEVRYMPSSAEPICTSIEDKSMQENVEVMRKHDINYTLTKTETCMPSTSSYDTVTVATMNGCLLSNDTHQTKDHCSPVLKSHGSSTCDDNVASLENDQTETVCGSSTTKENVNQELDGLAVSVDDDILSLGDNDSIDEFLLFEDSLDSFKAEEDQIDTDNVVKCSKTLNGNSLSGLVMRKSDEQTCDEPPRKVIVKDMTNSGGDELKSKPIVADDKGRQLFAKADSGGITKNVPPPIRDYSFGDTSDEAVTSLKVGSKSELSSKSIKSTIEKPPKKKSKKKKKSKISGSEIDVDKQTTSRRRVAITKQLLPNTVKPKLKVLHGTNEKSGVGEGIHVKETKRVVTFKSPTKKGKGQRAMNTSPKSTKGVDNLQKRKCGTSSPLAAKKMKLAFLPSMPLERGFQIPKLGTKGKDHTKTEKDVKPSSMITSVDPNLRTVKINLKTAVVQLQRLRTELRNTKKVSKDATDTSSTIGNQVSYLKGDNCVDKTGQNAQCKTTDSLKEDVIIKDKSPVSNQRLSEVYSGQLKTPTRTNSWTVVDEVGLSPVTLKSSIVVPLPKATVSNKVYQTSGQVRTGSKAAPPDDLTTATEAKLGAEKKNLQEENSSKVEHREREPCVEEKNQSGTQGSVVKLTDTQRIESLVGVVVSDTQKKERNEAAVGDKQNKESISVETNLKSKATEGTGVSTIKGNEESQAERKVPENIRKVEIVKQVDKKPARIVTSESKWKDKQLPSSSSSSSGKSKPSTTRPSRRFHPYVPSQIDSSRLVHWRRLKQPNMNQLMWDHTFMSPKIRRNSPPKDIFSALNTAQGRFKSMGDLKHQESLLKNAEECEPESTPGEVTNAKKSRAKTLDINILKLAADTNDIQQLLELDEMVYTLQSQQFPSRPLQVPHSVRYHPYY
ncbi:uncharacterized protein [Apostichopus japonicus]|uniref:uncharacterized protein isoform X3 n=1 Tax=Stichopus japonicus TaxID=307972 RepID=UPI003AB7D77C